MTSIRKALLSNIEVAQNALDQWDADVADYVDEYDDMFASRVPKERNDTRCGLLVRTTLLNNLEAARKANTTLPGPPPE